MSARARWFLAAVPELTAPWPDESALERALSEALSEARRAWPQLVLDDAAFLQHLAARLPSERDPVSSVAAVRAAELFLACACAHGDAHAVALLERHYMRGAAKSVMALDASPDALAEALQRAREKLLVGDRERAPGIAQYAGTGSLEGWLRVAAVRTALNLLRGSKREMSVRDSLLAAAGAGASEPELALLKQRYQTELEQATVRAFEQLPDDQRELLRLYVLDGLTLDELARIHGVNPSTVSRWLARIRDKIAADARRHFADRCQLPDSECDSLVRAVQSEMHISVARLLA